MHSAPHMVCMHVCNCACTMQALGPDTFPVQSRARMCCDCGAMHARHCGTCVRHTVLQHSFWQDSCCTITRVLLCLFLLSFGMLVVPAPAFTASMAACTKPPVFQVAMPAHQPDD